MDMTQNNTVRDLKFILCLIWEGNLVKKLYVLKGDALKGGAFQYLMSGHHWGTSQTEVTGSGLGNSH